MDDMTDAEKDSLAGLGKNREKFIASMDDDLNTADAIAAIFELISEVNGIVSGGASKAYAEKALAEIAELTSVLGLSARQGSSEEYAPKEDDGLQSLIDERAKARAEKNWARADEIRDELAAKGITLKYTPQGVQIIRS
jgi:cysteinyl-tRNA synthetase